jgi:hypothetical protein
MNPVSAKFAMKFGIPIVEIDSLFWMWDAIPSYLLKSTVYYIQRFIGNELQMEKYPPEKPIFVGAIIDTRFKTESNTRNNQLLINLGGMKSKLISPGQNSFYPHVIGKILSSVLSSHRFERVVIVGDIEALNESVDNWHIPRATFATLSHAEFLMELSNSALAILSPGLTSTFEAFYYGVPVVFLPPQNLSQFFIVKELRNLDVSPLSINWPDLYDQFNLGFGVSEVEGVNYILRWIQQIQHDHRAQEKAVGSLYNYIFQQDWRWLIDKQTKFITKIGSDGAMTIANDLIRRFSA